MRAGRQTDPDPAEAIVVLGAAQYDGRPSPQLAARLDHAARAVRTTAWRRWSMVTGGNQPGDRFTEAEASANYLVDRGVPETAIMREDAGHTTYESLDAAADQLLGGRARRGRARHRPLPLAAQPADRRGGRPRRIVVTDADQRRHRLVVVPARAAGGRGSGGRADHRVRPAERPHRLTRPVVGRRSRAVHSSLAPMGCGVTGNTADSGSVIQGSIPCTPTNRPRRFT